ncbi:ABC transporter ATP-binding protein [Caloranaerobacter azorensis]|uniref:ABC-2 type transport system ATP-binding protein n=3 Tax=Caloranaerobacter azorensis TaxID=116090 RepID=A0A1M5VX29_9FIRM|nr:ABC transporter ATP-binding protein [Caloranaerobacter azorensis]KGG79707.1 3-dehydroquinate dehydratase [Caloranaerobacter azorensis H53214]QIB26756.1 ABC transporter ATP-binding protein [Caloranaerobacter azorensis]SHH79859.1 ABC-2 type transport system ATP-binding protein [Caloranaerobacter azorensis DSM 13643]
MLKLENVSKSYNKGKIKAVDNVNIHVKPGEIFGFLGPNGAGKTTTIKMIVGLLKPDEGKIYIKNVDNQKEPLKAKKLISYVPDNPKVYERLTGIEYLNFMADMYGISKEIRNKRIREYLKVFELEDAVGDLIKSYSHGMKQKIVLIGALLNDPELFILDEPMVGLDPKSSFKLKEIMRKRCEKGKSVFFSTHVLEVAEKLCNRIAIINKGKIIAQGTMEELKGQFMNEESLENIFLELTEQ